MTAAHRVLALDHVQLACPAGGEIAARAFYGSILGFQELAKPPILAARGGAWFRAGTVELHLGVETPFAPAKKAHPGLAVTGLDELAAMLTAAGHEVIWADPEEIPGRRRFFTHDPFGNRLEFLETASPRTSGSTP